MGAYFALHLALRAPEGLAGVVGLLRQRGCELREGTAAECEAAGAAMETKEAADGGEFAPDARSARDGQ